MALGNVVHGGDAGAAADADNLFGRGKFFNVRRFSEGAAYVENDVSFAEFFQNGRRFSHDQIHNGDGAFFGIRIGDGQGKTFAMLVDAQHDEVSRPGRGGYLRRIQNKFAGSAGDKFFLVQNGSRHMDSLPCFKPLSVRPSPELLPGCSRPRSISECRLLMRSCGTRRMVSHGKFPVRGYR